MDRTTWMQHSYTTHIRETLCDLRHCIGDQQNGFAILGILGAEMKMNLATALLPRGTALRERRCRCMRELARGSDVDVSTRCDLAAHIKAIKKSV